MDINQQVYFLAQIVVAMLLGAVLGWQREQWGKSAGPRTYAMVAAGAALFTIMSVHGFSATMSPIVAAQVVTGIGFLGAGIIFHREDRVEGLTTAAGFWAVAAIGMVVALEYYILAVGATLLMLILFMVNDRRFRRDSNGEHHEV